MPYTLEVGYLACSAMPYSHPKILETTKSKLEIKKLRYVMLRQMHKATSNAYTSESRASPSSPKSKLYTQSLPHPEHKTEISTPNLAPRIQVPVLLLLSYLDSRTNVTANWTTEPRGLSTFAYWECYLGHHTHTKLTAGPTTVPLKLLMLLVVLLLQLFPFRL